MAEVAPSRMALWPRLRRRASKGCKAGKGKGKQNPYALRGLEKFAVVYAELQSRRDSMAEKVGAPVSMVRFLSRSARSWTAGSSSPTHDKDVVRNTVPHIDVLAPIDSEGIFESEWRQSDNLNSQNEVVENVSAQLSEETPSDCDNEPLASATDSICNSEGSLNDFNSSVSLALRREISSKEAFPELPLRGVRGVRRRRQSMCGREKIWRHATRTAVALIIALGAAFASKAADLGSSVLVAFSLDVVVGKWRKGKQFVSYLFSAIAKYLRGPLHSYLNALATKRLILRIPSTEEDNESKSFDDLQHPPCVTLHRRSSSFVFPVSSLDSSPTSPTMRSFTSHSPAISSRVSDPFVLRDSLGPVSPVVSPRCSGSSPSSSLEGSPSRVNKLVQFKSKIFKTFPLNRAASKEKDLAFSVPSSPLSESGHEEFSRFGWDSDTASSSSEVPDTRCTDNRVVKKKSFLQRRSMSRMDDRGIECSDSRSISRCRSRFASLRVNTSHSHEDFDGTSSAKSSRIQQLGKLRISTSLKDSPRRTEEDDSGRSKRCCSPREEKLRVSCSQIERSKLEPSTPRKSGLSFVSTIPLLEVVRVRETKKHQGHQAWLVVILLVSLLFLVVGRVPAILATSFSCLFFSQLDKFKHSGGVGRDKDGARRAVHASRKLTKSPTLLSPRPRSPESPRSPSTGSPRRSLANVSFNDHRKRIGLDSFFERGKKVSR